MALQKTVVMVRLRAQLCPPKLSAKLAVPVVAAVPLRVRVMLPDPVATVPADKVAVRPVTPVEESVWALYVPLLPPV